MKTEKLDSLQKKLITAARHAAPDDRVPYAFEKRIMARLISGPRVDLLGDWSAALWRAAVSCLAITLLTGAWTFYSSQRSSPADFSQELERVVYASASAETADEVW